MKTKGNTDNLKTTKDRLLLFGLILAGIIFIAVLNFIVYANLDEAVASDKVIISNVSELENGKIFFTLESDDTVYAKDCKWQEKNQEIYITIYASRYNFFGKKNMKYDFGMNTVAKNNWLFQVRNNGITKIYYTNAKRPTEHNSQLIWEQDMNLTKVSDEVRTYVKTYPCYGNDIPGMLAEQLFEAKNPYIGDMQANNRLASVINIKKYLGDYKVSLQTKEEPYGWTFEFIDKVEQFNQKEFNETMRNYAYVLIALTDNLSQVSWTYPSEDGQEKQHVSAKEATKALEKEIKSYSKSTIAIQELLYKTGIE